MQGHRRDTARYLAAKILSQVDSRKAYADILLDHVLNTTALPDRDRALLTELVYGTLRWRGRLDGHLQGRLRRSLDKTDPFLRNLLRLTLYQILFLDRIPDYAAVDEAVELAKAYRGGTAGGFLNGVLRNFLRTSPKLPPAIPGSLSAIATQWSHPEWLVQLWIDYLGREDIELLLQANNAAAPLVLRANVTQGTREGIERLFSSSAITAGPSLWSPQGLVLQSRMPVELLPGFQQGLFQVQGEASQLVTYLLDPQPGERILDACAAPGGKTTHIAEVMGDRGEVIATDISERGLKKLQDSARRLKLKSIKTLRADASKGPDQPFDRPFDRILVDAPCSGLGTLRAHPEIKWHRNKSDVLRLSRLQQKILGQASRHLKPGGVLVYSTCTLDDRENEKVINHFLQNHPGFVLENAASSLPPQARTLIRGCYFMALPHRHNTDGFFAARMRKVA